MNIHSFNRISNTALLKRFNAWEKLKNEGASIDHMIDEVGKIATGCPFQTVKTSNVTFFRARKNEGSSLFMNKKDVWYPPDNYVKNIGRANRIGDSKMYLSEFPRTTLFEMNLKEDDLVTISKLKLKTNQELNLQYLNGLEKIKPKSFKEAIRRKYHGLNKNGVKNYNLIHDFICREFTRIGDNIKNPNVYVLSTAIAEFLLKYERADGLLYPSIKSINDSNIVLKKNSADEKLELIECNCFTVRSPSKGSIEIKRIAQTTSIDEKTGVMKWHNNVENIPFWNENERFGMSKI